MGSRLSISKLRYTGPSPICWRTSAISVASEVCQHCSACTRAKATVNAPLEVAGGIATGALANLHHPFEVEQSLLNGAAEGGAVGDFLSEHLIIGVGMGVDVDEAHRTMFLVSARRIGRVMVWSPPRVSGISG